MILQDVKPPASGGAVVSGKSSLQLLESWLRHVTSGCADHVTGTLPPARTSQRRRRKGRPRKYVAAAGDRTLTGDALLADSAPVAAPSPRQPSPQPPRQEPAVADRAVKRASKVGRRKASVFQQQRQQVGGRRQPVKFIPSVDRTRTQVSAPVQSLCGRPAKTEINF